MRRTRYYIGTAQAFRHPNFQQSIFSRPDALLWMVAHGWRNSSFGYGPGMTFTTKSFKSYLYKHSYIQFVQLVIGSCKLSHKFSMANTTFSLLLTFLGFPPAKLGFSGTKMCFKLITFFCPQSPTFCLVKYPICFHNN